MGGIDVAGLEAAEAEACRDFWAAAPAGVREAFGIEAFPVGPDGLQLIGARLPGMVFNRILGFGSGTPSDPAELDRAIGRFDARGVPAWVLQVPPGGAAVALGAALGLAPHPRAWMKFVRGDAPPVPARTALTVRAAGPADAGAFGAVLAASFGLPADLAGWGAALVGRPGWRTFLGSDGAEPVAIGAIRLGPGYGWLGFGGTLPRARGRGGQSAIFAARIAAGLAEGCRGFVTETGVPLAGEPAPSYRNILRAGFAEAYARPNLRRPPAAA
jgi:hypothetical protein